MSSMSRKAEKKVVFIQGDRLLWVVAQQALDDRLLSNITYQVPKNLVDGVTYAAEESDIYEHY